MRSRPKTVARLVAVLVLGGALAALLLGGLLSQSSGRENDFATGSGGPSANWASHCAHVSGGPPPKHHTRLVIGLNSVWNDDCNLAAVAGAGVTMERVELSWETVEPKPDSWTFAKYDQEFAKAARHGITVLPLLMDTPSWAGPTWNTFPRDPATYAEYVAHVVARYGRHGSFWRGHRDLPSRPVTWFEVWNEPYLSQFSAGGVNPGAYARLFKAAAQAGKRADRTARFLASADLYGREEDGSSTISWVNPMFSAVPDLAHWVDGVAVHPYTTTDSPDDYDPHDPQGEFRRIENIRQQFAAHGAGDRPFWITEVGWSTCPANPDGCVSEGKQAAYLQRAFQIVKSDYPWVKAVFPYNYRDSVEDNVADTEAWFGLIRRAGQPKPAWNVLKAAARA